MSRAAPLRLRPGDEPKLTALLRATTVQAGMAQRARIVLLAAEGMTNVAISALVGVSRPTVTVTPPVVSGRCRIWSGPGGRPSSTTPQ